MVKVRIISESETWGVTPKGELVKYVEVEYEVVDTGYKGIIRIPKEFYSRDVLIETIKKELPKESFTGKELEIK